MQLTSRHVRGSKGFTLVELMITLLVSSVLLIVIFRAYVGQQKVALIQDQVVNMQQQARAGLDMMTRDIRLAGFDPDHTGNFGVTVATSKEFKFGVDWNRDGKLDDGTLAPDETLHYRLDNGNLKRTGVFTIGKSSKDVDVALNIEELEFLYILDDGTQKLDLKNDAERDRIRGVTITMLARVDKDDDSFTNNMTYTTAGDQSWKAKKDGYRRRLFMTTVKCRNLGVKI